MASSFLVAQPPPTSHANDPQSDVSLRQHYSAAQNEQAAGNLDRAAVEYKAFLAEILHRLADRRAQSGDVAKAAEFFKQALPLAPHDVSLRLDYAEACRDLGDMEDAQAAADSALREEPRNARAHFVLGRILLRRGENGNETERATQQLELAVAGDSTFEHGYWLGVAYLKRKAPDRTATVFAEMLAGLGDTPAIHMEFGRAYAEAGYPEQAILEFKKTLAQDDKFPGAHYSLGAAYLVGLADAAFPEAAEEFRKELKDHPDDVLSLYQLGYIALSQHQLKEAEEYLSRTATLDPRNPDVYLSLGQVYAETERRTEAETALRKSIALTQDISRNHFQVQRAHYLLGRLLMQTGRPEEAKEELRVADQLLKQSVAANQGQTSSSQGSPGKDPQLHSEPEQSGASVLTSAATHASSGDGKPDVGKMQEDPDPTAVKQIETYERKVSPAIADSYNNLAVILATSDRFSEALSFFQLAASWNPSLEGIDYNLGKAALAANQYDQAIAPLNRYLQLHPDDGSIRSALGSALFDLKRYAEAVMTLKPLENELSASPQVDYVYSAALIKTGATAAGVTRLQNLENVMPKFVDLHVALADAYSSQGDHANAIRELRLALSLNPADTGAQQRLARESAAR